jgi:hypothetical protein
MQGSNMITQIKDVRAPAVVVAALLVAGLLGGCASSEERKNPSPEYARAAADTPDPKCPAGFVLQCETKNTGRIRFGMIGKKNLQRCACEQYQGMPTQSPLPGIY